MNDGKAISASWAEGPDIAESVGFYLDSRNVTLNLLGNRLLRQGAVDARKVFFSLVNAVRKAKSRAFSKEDKGQLKNIRARKGDPTSTS